MKHRVYNTSDNVIKRSKKSSPLEFDRREVFEGDYSKRPDTSNMIFSYMKEKFDEIRFNPSLISFIGEANKYA